MFSLSEIHLNGIINKNTILHRDSQERICSKKKASGLALKFPKEETDSVA